MEYLTYMRTQWHWGSGIGQEAMTSFDNALRELHRQGARPGTERYTWRSWSAPDGSNLRIGHSEMGEHVVTFGDEPSDDDALVLIESGDFEPTYLPGTAGPGGARVLNPRRGRTEWVR